MDDQDDDLTWQQRFSTLMKEVRNNASEWENAKQRLSDTRQNLENQTGTDFNLIWQYIDEKFENLENNLAISLGIVFSMNEADFRHNLKEEREEMKSVAKQRGIPLGMVIKEQWEKGTLPPTTKRLMETIDLFKQNLSIG